MEHALDDRIAAALGPFKTQRKRMFGGTCYMLNGNMLLGTFRGGLMARVAKAHHAAMMKHPGTKPMVMKERVMEGFILVDADAVASDAALQAWINRALAYNATLPAKAAKAKPSVKARSPQKKTAARKY